MDLNDKQKDILRRSLNKIKQEQQIKVQAIEEILTTLNDSEKQLSIEQANNALVLFDEVTAKGRTDIYEKVQIIIALENIIKEGSKPKEIK